MKTEPAKIAVLTLLLLTCVSCTKKELVYIDLPFQQDQIERIELYELKESSVSASKFVVEENLIEAYADLFSRIAVEEIEYTEDVDSAAYFCYHLTNGEKYTFSYIGIAVKNGVLTTPSGETYRTSADIYGIWLSLYGR